jgi:hypothetical protein
MFTTLLHCFYAQHVMESLEQHERLVVKTECRL